MSNARNLANFLGTSTTVPSGKVVTASLPTGSVLQVKYAEVDRNSDSQTMTSQTFGDLSGYSLAITPTSTSSKILISYGIHTLAGPSTGAWHGDYRTQVIRGSTVIYPTTYSDYEGGVLGPTNSYNMQKFESTYLDTPNTTSAITYKVQARSRDGNSIYFNQYANGHMVIMEIAG